MHPNVLHHVVLSNEVEGVPIEQTYVLVHGAGCSSQHMNLLGSHIVTSIENSKVVLVDLDGHGKSIHGDHYVKTVEGHAEKVFNLLKVEGLVEGKLNYVGWSLGGTIGIYIAINSDILDTLTLLATSSRWTGLSEYVQQIGLDDPAMVYDVAKSVISSEIAIYDNEFAKDLVNNYDNYAPPAMAILNDFAALTTDKVDYYEELDEIQIPTKVLVGKEDILATLDMSLDLLMFIPDATLEVLEAGHAFIADGESVEIVVSNLKQMLTV